MNNLDRDARNYVYDRALGQFGLLVQIIVAIEELSELAKELCKLQRDPYGYETCNLSEEIADVRIMLEQLERIFHLTEDVNVWMDEKVSRLMGRVMAAKAEQDKKEKEHATGKDESNPQQKNSGRDLRK